MSSQQKLKLITNTQLRVIIVENPFENWKAPLIPDLFQQTVNLKRLGYEGYYPKGFLPLDTGDFVATHHLICEENEQGFSVIAGYRSLKLETCNTYGLRFPGLAVLDKDKGVEKHQAAAKIVLDQIQKSGKSMSFGSGFTVHPKIRGDREMVAYLKDITRALMINYPLENGIDEEMGLSVPKVKTDKFFSEIGYEFISLHGTALPPFKHADIGNDEVYLIHRTGFTPYAYEALKRHQSLLENKIHLGLEQSDSSIRKIA